VNIEDAGFEIRDMIQWLYGSGFPKSMDISKAIDKEFGKLEEREVIGVTECGYRRCGRSDEEVFLRGIPKEQRVVPEAAKWQGWGTALKPACEPIVLARKPISERNTTQNVLKWGTGGLNISACRISAEKPIERGRKNREPERDWGMKPVDLGYNYEGRFPANVILEKTCIPIMRLINSGSGIISPEQRKVLEEYYDNYEVPRMWERIQGISKQDKEWTEEILFERMLLQKSKQDDERKEPSNVWKETQTGVNRENEEEKAVDSEKRKRTSEIQGVLDEQRLQVHQYRHTASRTKGNRIENDTKGTQGDSGTQIGNGSKIRKTTKTGRNSASSQWDKRRQSTRKSGSKGQFHTCERTQRTGRNGETVNCRKREVEKREREIEVLACDIPIGWSKYFEPTGYYVVSPYSSAKMLDEQSGVLKSGKMAQYIKGGKWAIYGKMYPRYVETYGDSGGASRFFYCAKAGRDERFAYCHDCKEVLPQKAWQKHRDHNVEFHPTIKPLKLIEYLIRLITPPNGIVLDPFFGTGTTGIASLKQGFRFIGIEISEPYVKTAEHRLKPYLAQQRLIEFDVVIEERDWIGIML
jgi:hypothetical protein